VSQFEKDIKNYIQETRLEKFFPPNDPFLETVVENAVRLKRDPRNSLDVKDLATVSLYRPVLYCGKLHEYLLRN
jgi:hypothetical protein